MRRLFFSGATVVDGTGRPAYRADVVVEEGKIADIGLLGRPEGAIDARGKILCPGFIDMHAHSEIEVLRDPSMGAKTAQGITSELTGNCGTGVFPSPRDDGFLKCLTRDVLGSWPGHYWRDFSAYRREVEKRGSGTTMGFLTSHSALRATALSGNPNRSATKEEVELMCRLLAASLDEGSLGFSTGLYYAPCMFAEREEIKALLSVVRQRGKLFAVHHRCEGNDILASLDEVLSLAGETGVRMEVSHLKAIGGKNQEKVGEALSRLEKARERGVDVAFDQYPYPYGSTSLFSLLPPLYLKMERKNLKRALRDGEERKKMKAMMASPVGWDSIVEMVGFASITVLALESNPAYRMMSLSDIASSRGQDPYDALFDILADEDSLALMADVTESEESLIRILRHPLMCFGTDALYAGGLSHPRSWGAATHLLSRYGRVLHVMPWEELIRKMSGECASRMNLRDAGTVEKGKRADLVLFDPNRVEDHATLRNPEAKADGLDLVLVGGEVVAVDGVPLPVVAGRVHSL